MVWIYPEGDSAVHIHADSSRQGARMAAAKMPESEEMTTSTPEDPAPSSNDVMTLHDLHQRKYFALKQKCEQMQQVGAYFSRIH